MMKTFALTRRAYSTIIDNIKLTNLQANLDGLNISIRRENRYQTVSIPLVWLRDHCRSSKCFNHSTNQRKSNMIDIIEQAKVDGEHAVSMSSEKLHINWQDGHVSEFSIENILAMFLRKDNLSAPSILTSWDSTGHIPRQQYGSFDYGRFCREFVKYGVAIVDGIEGNASATEEFCRSIAPIHDTYYGAFWVFSNETKADEGEEYHEDTAYSNEQIGPHTDGTYFTQTPGIQVFHCLQPAAVGGDTVVVDGLRCVEILKRQNPEAYKILTTVKIDHEYLEGEGGSILNSICKQHSVIEVDEQDQLIQIRFNPYDRAPFTIDPAKFSASQMIDFYRAYSEFSRICHDENLAMRVALRPGSVIFIDNFRVFHSRTAFQGYRQMSGCYLSRDNFLAKARPHLEKEQRYTF